MKNKISVLIASVLLIALVGCKKDNATTVKETDPTVKFLKTSDEVVTKLLATKAVSGYLERNNYTIAKEVKCITNGLRSELVIPIHKSNRSEGSIYLVVMVEDDASIYAPFEVKETLYYQDKVGYDVKSLLDENTLVQKYGWKITDGIIVPDVRTCGGGTYAACVWNCFTSLFGDPLGAITCTLMPHYCMAGAALACAAIVVPVGGFPNASSRIIALQNAVSSGYLKHYIQDNSIYLIQ